MEKIMIENVLTCDDCKEAALDVKEDVCPLEAHKLDAGKVNLCDACYELRCYELKMRGYMMNNIEIDFSNDGFKIQAELKVDKNQWCVGVGVDVQSGCYGFGHTPMAAITEFKDEFRNYKKPNMVEVIPGTLDALAKITITKD